MNIGQSVTHNLIYKKFYAKTSQNWELYAIPKLNKTLFEVEGLTKDDVNTQTTACTLYPMLSGTLMITLYCGIQPVNSSAKCNFKIINTADETDILLDEDVSVTATSTTIDRLIEVAAYKTYKVIYTPTYIGSSTTTLKIKGTMLTQIIDNPDMYIQVVEELPETKE